MKPVDTGRGRRALVSFAYAMAVTALFALICPALLVVILIVYARFAIHKSVEIEWGFLGMLQDPLGVVACGVVFVTVFVLKVRAKPGSSQTARG
jgi:predicted acyltransferase